ncbi:MAG TPA: hypothetical protein VFA20_11795 [Myxococcaceae bacterium]|nr:hypothetical protein [Myxococcaceae bacterium]
MIWRRIGAVLAGFLAIVVLSSAVDAALHAVGVFPPLGQSMSDGLFALATGYRIVISIGGCYLAARLAPDRPLAHAMALGVVGVIASAAGAVATWNMPIGPHWYPLLLVAVSLPCAYAGGKLRILRAGRSARASA